MLDTDNKPCPQCGYIMEYRGRLDFWQCDDDDCGYIFKPRQTNDEGTGFCEECGKKISQGYRLCHNCDRH